MPYLNYLKFKKKSGQLILKMRLEKQKIKIKCEKMKLLDFECPAKP